MPGSDSAIRRCTSPATTAYRSSAIIWSPTLSRTFNFRPCGLGLGSRPVISAPCRPPSCTSTSMPMSQCFRLLVQCRAPMRVALTVSSHTSCQMPVVRGYQIECGSSFQSCLPRGFSRSSELSSARTTISCTVPSTKACVISAQNGVNPPWCEHIRLPFTHTSASQSTASKCTSNRFPSGRGSCSQVRRYHTAV